MPMGSEQNDPANLLGWEPWLQATLGWEVVAARSSGRPAGRGRVQSSLQHGCLWGYWEPHTCPASGGRFPPAISRK